jgi:hypothetical protein
MLYKPVGTAKVMVHVRAGPPATVFTHAFPLVGESALPVASETSVTYVLDDVVPATGSTNVLPFDVYVTTARSVEYDTYCRPRAIALLPVGVGTENFTVTFCVLLPVPPPNEGRLLDPPPAPHADNAKISPMLSRRRFTSGPASFAAK